jgi:hypothetical protein
MVTALVQILAKSVNTGALDVPCGIGAAGVGFGRGDWFAAAIFLVLLLLARGLMIGCKDATALYRWFINGRFA